ncbi:MAG: hypothetical protein WAM58_01690 [Candidatus Acidiferrum sp.]
MARIMNYPGVVLLFTFVVLWVASWVGATFRRKREVLSAEERDDLGMVLTATLTLLGLIIGFTFSMAISRYDQRKNLEEEEANAIGTEYVRADLLPAANGEKVRELLKSYLEQRILFYKSRDAAELAQVKARTAQMQAELWNAVKGPAETTPTPVAALLLSGMNDVLNSQGYTQAAWWNRIPIAAWVLMWVIAILCNLMIGYYVRPADRKWIRLVVMPLVVAVSFMLVADIDSPRGGVIRVKPLNLVSLQEGWK